MWLSVVFLATMIVAPGVELVPGKFVPNSQPDGNSVVIRAPRGLIVVDTGRHPEHTNAVLDAARAAGQPVVAIINSHWHLDHIGGNALIRRAYPHARVYASGAFADARKGFLANYRKQLVAMIDGTNDAAQQKAWRTEVALIDNGDALAPTDTVDKSGTRDIGGRKLQIGLETDAATAGDVWVFDPATRVLASGDLITLPAPFLDTACPAGWKTALDHLAAVDFKVVIPGHGAPMTRDDFNIYRTAFTNLIACKEDCVNGWMRDAAPLIRNDDPDFVRSLMDYYVNQVLRAPTPERCRSGA